MAKILIMEDEVEEAALLADTLMGFGHQTVVTYDDKAAYDAYEKEHFDLVITDIVVMGERRELGGVSLVDQIRKAEIGQGRRMLIITLSGSTFTSLMGSPKARFESAGADLHLTKPVSGAELQEHIQTLLQQRYQELDST